MALDNEFSEEAGIHLFASIWIPAFAGMTVCTETMKHARHMGLVLSWLNTDDSKVV